VVRLWVAASDYREDVRFVHHILDTLSEGYRKIRNTAPVCLSQLHDSIPGRTLSADCAVDRPRALSRFERYRGAGRESLRRGTSSTASPRTTWTSAPRPPPSTSTL